MKTFLKIAGITLGIWLVLVVMIVAGAYFWWMHKGDLFVEEAVSAADEAKEFSKHIDQDACVLEAITRLKTSDGLLYEVNNRVFLKYCLEEAKPRDGFCKGVPKRKEIVRSVSWALATCREYGRPNDQPCTRLVRMIQEHCYKPKAVDSR
ncbi:hypothetical protein ACFL6Y_03885 [Elusimicrobiota bacterium]